MQGPADPVVEIDGEAILVVAAEEDHRIDPGADIRAHLSIRRRPILQGHHRRQDPGVVDFNICARSLGADLVLGRAQDRLDGPVVRDEIGEAQRRHHVLFNVDVQAGGDTGRRQDRIVRVR